MGFWSRIADFARGKDSGSVGSEMLRLTEDFGLTNAGIPVNSFTAMQHVAVMSCVSILSEDVAKLPLDVYRRLPNGGKEPAKEHWFYGLLHAPNNWQTRFEWVEMMQAALVLRGNAYSVIVRNARGVPQYLVPVHPDRVTLYEAPGGEYFYLVTRQGLHEMAVLAKEPILVPSEDMLHVRWLSMWNSLLGISRIQMMRESVGLSMSQEQMAARFAGTGARPGGVLQTDRKLSNEVIGRLKADWQQAQGGVRSSGKTAILEEGLKWQALGMTMQDAEFIESRQFSLQDIARGFRVPLYKLGVPNEGPAANQVQAEQDYLNSVISSYCDRWTAKLDATFGLDGVEMFTEFNYDRLIKADIQTRLTSLKTGVMGMLYTPNEGRASLGLPAVDAGDTLYQPTNVAPIGFTPTAGGSGPGSDLTGTPGAGGDGDPTKPVGDEPAPSS